MPFRSFRFSLRFVVPLALMLGFFAYVVVPLMDNLTLRWFVRDLDIRSQLLASTLQEPLLEHVPQQSRSRITQLFDKAIQDERLYALGFYDGNGVLLVNDLNVYRWAGHMPLDVVRLRQRERIMSKIHSHRRGSLRRVV